MDLLLPKNTSPSFLSNRESNPYEETPLSPTSELSGEESPMKRNDRPTSRSSSAKSLPSNLATIDML